MQNIGRNTEIEKEFNTYYLKQLNNNNLLPQFITEFYNTRACLAFSETKCIYLISDIASNQKYILKQVSRQHLPQSKKEWDMLSSLSHPSIPKVYKWYSDDNYTYMLREYFEGMTLDAYVLGNGTVQEAEAVKLAIQLCDLLIYLHSQVPPVIHRDIKPQNLVLRPDGKIGLIDFETSRVFDLQAGNDTVYMGTLQTAAPEQFGYQQTNRQTDIYALGIILIYLGTGSYERANACHMTPWLRKIAEKCTEFSPKDRYKNAEEVKKHLLGRRISIFPKRKIAEISVFFAGILLLFGMFTAAYLAKQAKSANYGQVESLYAVSPGVERTESAPTKVPDLEPTESISSVSSDGEETESASAKEPDTEQTENAPAKVPDLEPTKSISSVSSGGEETESASAVNPGTEQTESVPTSSPGTEDTENVSFKNPGIEKAIRKALGKTAGEPVTKSELEKIIYLEIIGDLPESVVYEDLSHDYYMNRAAYKGEYLERGPVDSLEDLALLPYLIDLSLVYQQISDLSGIEKLQHLQRLTLAYNNISDLTPLKDMEKLKFLRINCNPIKDLSPLKNLSNLEFLQISATQVDDLTPISSIQSLETLDVFGIKNLDLSPLKDLKNLKKIYQ